MPETDPGTLAVTLATALAKASPGDKAAARRMGDGGSPFFWRMAARHGLRRHEEAKWRLIVKCIAMLTPASADKSIHDEGRPFGAVLADGGDLTTVLKDGSKERAGRPDAKKPTISEERLARLMAARGDARLRAIERAVRALARARPTLDVASLAWAVLKDDPADIARDYYRRLDRAPAKKDQTTDA